MRALKLGDLLCAIPAIRALRHEFDDAEIYLIGLPSAREIVARFSRYFNGLIEFPGFPGLPEQPYDVFKIARFITAMQKQSFDLIIQMQGNGRIVNPLVQLFGARYTAGFYREGDDCPPGGLFLPYPGGHEIGRHLALMEHLGVRAAGRGLEFPLKAEDRKELQDAGIALKRNSYVCVNPGSSASWRQWPACYFAMVADQCCERRKDVVLTGTSDEIALVRQVASFMRHKPVIAAGKTTLGALAFLISESFAVVSNCTGTSHLAAAFGKPGIIISMDGEPERWGPLDKEKLTTVDWLKIPDFEKVQRLLDGLFAAFDDGHQPPAKKPSGTDAREPP